jgi:hypothetical protein
MYVNSSHSQEVDHWKELYIKESHTSDSLKVHTSKEVIVKAPELTWWERFKMSEFGNIFFIFGFILLGYMGYKAVKIYQHTQLP